MIRIVTKRAFNLDNTVTCGQIFRYFKQENGSYDIILKDRVINVLQKKDTLLVSSNNEKDLEKVVENYFDLNTNYDEIGKAIVLQDEKIKDAVMFSKGLTMIRQDPFETIIAYIISANNGVAQIAAALNNIAKNYGNKVIFNEKEYYLFPNNQALKNLKVQDFRACKVGFRDCYLCEMVSKINNGDIKIEEIYNLDTKSALSYLMNNRGIGPKVASCILLFAYQKYDVFPVDTWVKKIMKERYNIVGEKSIRAFAKETYGNYSGIAIQYLFNESRNKN